MAGPQISDWNRHEEILSANVQGFNPLKDLPKLLAKEFAWARDYVMCFSSEEDIPENRSKGWQHMRMEWLGEGKESFNRAMPLRFGITDDGGGNVRWRDNWLMVMPKTLRAEVVAARNAASEARYSGEVERQTYAAPGDTGGSSESSLDQRSIKTAPPQEEVPKRKPGRPKKIKE